MATPHLGIDRARTLPKIELHVHLDGSFDTKLMYETALRRMADGSLDKDVAAKVAACADVEAFHNIVTCQSGDRSLMAMLERFFVFLPIVSGELATLEELASFRESQSQVMSVVRMLLQLAQMEGPLRMIGGPPAPCDLATFNQHLSALANNLNTLHDPKLLGEYLQSPCFTREKYEMFALHHIQMLVWLQRMQQGAQGGAGKTGPEMQQFVVQMSDAARVLLRPGAGGRARQRRGEGPRSRSAQHLKRQLRNAGGFVGLAQGARLRYRRARACRRELTRDVITRTRCAAPLHSRLSRPQAPSARRATCCCSSARPPGTSAAARQSARPTCLCCATMRRRT